MKAFSRVFLIIAGIFALAAGGYKAYLLFKPVFDGGSFVFNLTNCIALALSVIAIIAGVFAIFLSGKLPGICLFLGIILFALGIAAICFNGFDAFIDTLKSGTFDDLAQVAVLAAAPLIYLIASLFNKAFAKK